MASDENFLANSCKCCIAWVYCGDVHVKSSIICRGNRGRSSGTPSQAAEE
jgi:hypothetical protein